METASMRIDGAIPVTPDLALKLFESLPEVGQAGVAQLFAARLVSGPLADGAVAAAARVYMERCKIHEKGAAALREAVAERCREIGVKNVDEAKVLRIIEDETRRACAKAVEERLGEILGSIAPAAVFNAAMPAILEVIGQCSKHYFARSAEGQTWLHNTVRQVCESEVAAIRDRVAEELCAAAEPMVQGTMASMRMVGARDMRPRGKASDNGAAESPTGELDTA